MKILNLNLSSLESNQISYFIRLVFSSSAKILICISNFSNYESNKQSKHKQKITDNFGSSFGVELIKYANIRHTQDITNNKK